MTTADLNLLKQHVDQIYILVTTHNELTETQMKYLREYCMALHKMVRCIVPKDYIEKT